MISFYLYYSNNALQQKIHLNQNLESLKCLHKTTLFVFSFQLFFMLQVCEVQLRKKLKLKLLSQEGVAVIWRQKLSVRNTTLRLTSAVYNCTCCIQPKWSCPSIHNKFSVASSHNWPRRRRKTPIPLQSSTWVDCASCHTLYATMQHMFTMYTAKWTAVLLMPDF